MKTPSTLALICLTLMPLSAFAGNESVYTDFDVKKCKTIAEAEVSVTMKCEGLKGYPVYFTDGDLRQSVIFGPAAQDDIDNTFESFGPFNHTGGKIEWRVDGSGKPYAAILRWFIENMNTDTGETDPKLTGQVLVVSRVTQSSDESGCVVGYVDALENKNANTLARDIADKTAADFACGEEKAAFHGKRGTKASEPTSSFTRQ